jgi:hypothetical protein
MFLPSHCSWCCFQSWISSYPLHSSSHILPYPWSFYQDGSVPEAIQVSLPAFQFHCSSILERFHEIISCSRRTNFSEL